MIKSLILSYNFILIKIIYNYVNLSYNYLQMICKKNQNKVIQANRIFNSNI